MITERSTKSSNRRRYSNWGCIESWNEFEDDDTKENESSENGKMDGSNMQFSDIVDNVEESNNFLSSETKSHTSRRRSTRLSIIQTKRQSLSKEKTEYKRRYSEDIQHKSRRYSNRFESFILEEFEVHRKINEEVKRESLKTTHSIGTRRKSSRFSVEKSNDDINQFVDNLYQSMSFPGSSQSASNSSFACGNSCTNVPAFKEIIYPKQEGYVPNESANAFYVDTSSNLRNEKNHRTKLEQKLLITAIMEIDEQFDSLHLSEPRDKKRRLSGIFKRRGHNCPIINETDTSGSLEGLSANITMVQEENEPISTVETPNTRRSGRRKSAPIRWDSQNIASNTTTVLNSNNLAAIEKYYLDKTVKRTTTCLETIFEEGQQKKVNIHNVMSVRKLRRSLNFSDTLKVNPSKIRKRRLKSLKVNKSKQRLIMQNSLEELHKKLSSIDM